VGAERACGRARISLRLGSTAAAALTIAIALPALAGAQNGIPHHGRGVTATRVRMSAHSATAYWTRARMAHAKPLSVESPAAAGHAPSTHSSTQPQGDPVVIDPAAPAGWQPYSTTPAPAGDRGGIPYQSSPGPISYTSFELTDTTSYPNRTHGIIFFKLGKFNYSCSGTAVNSTSGSVVMTAGHCVHEGGRHRPWATNLIFAPGYQDRVAPFGTWAARRLFTTKLWRKKARFSGDVGAAALNPNPAGQTVLSAVGARGIAFNLPRELTYRAYGYPVTPDPPFDGESLWACDSQFGYTDPYPEPKGPPQSAIGCNMQAGSSGGGWVVDDQFVNSSNSFGYSFLPEILFGPYYGDLAAQVYGSAAAAG
jgi:V8-like Glu-specific endopeptidase